MWVSNAGADVLTGAAGAWEWERKLDALLAVDLKDVEVASCRPAERRGRWEPVDATDDLATSLR